MFLPAEFKRRFFELATPPDDVAMTPEEWDDVIQTRLDDAVEWLDPAEWNGAYRRAVFLYAAFQLAKSLAAIADGPISGVSGPTTSASVGGESVGYANNSRFGQGTTSDDEYLKYPPYGTEYMALRDTVISGGKITSSGFRCGGPPSCL